MPKKSKKEDKKSVKKIPAKAGAKAKVKSGGKVEVILPVDRSRGPYRPRKTEEEKLLKLVGKESMIKFENYLKLKASNKVMKLEGITLEVFSQKQGEIKSLREVLSDLNFLIRGEKEDKNKKRT